MLAHLTGGYRHLCNLGALGEPQNALALRIGVMKIIQKI
jgi:hypothetical protein